MFKFNRVFLAGVLIALISNGLITEPVLSKSDKNKVCKDNNGHGNNRVTDNQEVDIHLSDGKYLKYVYGTYDPSNPGKSVYNKLKLYSADHIEIGFDMLTTTEQKTLISLIEDVELKGGKSSESSDCQSDDSDLSKKSSEEMLVTEPEEIVSQPPIPVIEPSEPETQIHAD